MNRNATMAMAMFFLVSLVGGCASTFDSETPDADEYSFKTTVSRGDANLAVARTVPVQLIRIETAAGYDTRRILVTYPDGRLDVIAGARWAGPTPQLLEAAVIDHLRAAGVEIHSSSAALAAPYALQVTVRRFDAEYSSEEGAARAVPPTVRVALDVTLIHRRDRRPIGVWSVSGSSIAAENRRAAIVAAFGSATTDALKLLTDELARVTALKQ